MNIVILELGPVSYENPENLTFYRSILEFLNSIIFLKLTIFHRKFCEMATMYNIKTVLFFLIAGILKFCEFLKKLLYSIQTFRKG